VSAAACIFLHIRDLCRGVCVLNRSNNSLFMVRQSVFEQCTMHITCGEGGVYFGGSWVTSCFSPLPRRGRGVAYSSLVLLVFYLRLKIGSQVIFLLLSYAAITRTLKKPYRASDPPSRSLGFTDNYHLHLLLQQAGAPWDPTGASQGFPVNP
jgi:hypothetical protein